MKITATDNEILLELIARHPDELEYLIALAFALGCEVGKRGEISLEDMRKKLNEVFEFSRSDERSINMIGRTLFVALPPEFHHIFKVYFEGNLYINMAGNPRGIIKIFRESGNPSASDCRFRRN